MSDETMILLSFLLFMFFFAGVGLASMRVKEDTTDDYLVAGRGMHPGLAALSAVSTWNSGYMFIGFIGFIYIQGYSAIWIALVSTIGQLVAWMWLYKYIQKEGEERGIRSLTSLVSNTTGSPEAKVAAVLSVIFLSIYAAAQLTAGGVALETMLNWAPTIGILIGFVLVVAYCYAGGIRASIWTDAAQSSVMIVGSTILCLVAVKSSGGLSGLHNELAGIDSSMVNVFPSGLKFGASLWIAAFFLGGLGVAGQPQVVSRVMTLKDDAARKQALVWFFVWQTPFIILMFIIGLACRVLLPELGSDGAQTGLPMLAMEQLNPFLGGVILASIFAATMSTADSQVLACTAAITDDVQPDWSQDHKTTKMVTLAMAALATVISLVGQQFPGFGDSVFALVVLAVYGLGGIFVPMILVRMSGYEPDTTHSIMMMIAAMSGVLVWTVLGYGDAEGIFPSVPGVGAAFATHFLLCWLRDESPSNAFGRYAVPTQKPAAIGLAILLAVVAVTEVSYQVFAPDSANNANKVAAYEVRGDVSFHEIVSGSEYVEDGASIDVGAFVDEEGEFSELNIVGVRLTIGHGPDDETQQGVGCALADGPQDDTVDYSYAHNEENFSNVADAALLDVYVEWYNASIVNNIVDGLSMLEIEEMLDGDGNGFGQHDMTLGVEVETGGGLGCQSNDDGEEVRYSIQLISLEYEITRV